MVTLLACLNGHTSTAMSWRLSVGSGTIFDKQKDNRWKNVNTSTLTWTHPAGIFSSTSSNLSSVGSAKQALCRAMLAILLKVSSFGSAGQDPSGISWFLLLDNHVKNKKYGNFVSISGLTGKCAAQKLKNFCISSLWTCLHHMVILISQNQITDFLMILAWLSLFKYLHSCNFGAFTVILPSHPPLMFEPR